MAAPEASATAIGSDDELELLLAAELEQESVEGEEQEADGSESLEAERPVAKRQKIERSRAAACPPHPGYMGGVCIRCGELKGGMVGGAQEEGEDASGGGGGGSVALRYIHRGLEVSAEEAERLRRGTQGRLLAGRKLLLILDLDHTLLNSTRFVEVDPRGEELLRAQLESQSKEEPMLFCLPHMRMWTKLRPGVREFLRSAHDSFELHIYTMGDREYALEMARLLDPEGKLFHGRVISSGDSTQRWVKDLDVVLGNERAALVLDDTEGVWPRHRDNLLQIERYIYFPACAQRFGLGQPSLLHQGGDEDVKGGGLAVSLRVLSAVHESFFAEGGELEEEADVQQLLRGMRQRILAGCGIVFSRVVPLSCTDPSTHPLWQLATRLGAECSTAVGEGVTHVVATDCTDKTRWARRHGRHVVSPAWLWACAFVWQRVEEERYPVAASSGVEQAAAAAAVQPAGVATEAEDVQRALAAAGGGSASEEASPPLEQPPGS